MQRLGVLIEFLDDPPALVSAGHDGLCPYKGHPFDELFVIAYRWGNRLEEQSVTFCLPYNSWLDIENHIRLEPMVRVHRSGFLWHDRTREVHVPRGAKWLSEFGFTNVDPRSIEKDQPEVFAVLPGSPMRDDLTTLLTSKQWRRIRDFHSRQREWMPANKPAVTRYDARRIERDSVLVADLKRKRGAACQICGFAFTKADGTEYCEVHHLEALADGGLDVASNCIVVCANCHKRFHYGNVEIISHTSNLCLVKFDEEIHSCVVG